jgi:Flp pilus assembly protein TadG
MNRNTNLRQRRRGAIAPLTAVLLIPLLGMIAFAVDLGWITHTQNELQSAADAAALAGAGQLPDNFDAYYMIAQNGQSISNQNASRAAILTTTQGNATTYAKKYAGYNRAGEVASLTLADADITFGFTDGNGNYTAQPAYTGYPNTVTVTLRRDASANGPLGMFFARVLGIDNVNLKATASATIYAGAINTFQTANSNLMVMILPMTYDVNHWNNFVATGQGPDGGTDLDASGIPQLGVYPSLKFKGNFGELSLDQGNDGASTISGWIDNGVATSDLKQEVFAGLLPLSKHNPNSAPDWKGNPGLKTSTIHTTANHVGGIYFLPLFKPVNDGSSNPANYQAGTGQGANYFYDIVQFVAVKISYVDNKAIKVEPAAMVVPSALLTGIVPAAPPPTGSSTLFTTFTGAKLTQ